MLFKLLMGSVIKVEGASHTVNVSENKGRGEDEEGKRDT